MGLRTKVTYFIRHYGFGTAGAITAIGFLINEKLKDAKVAHAAKQESVYSYQPSVKWDYNWDRREPENLVKPPKKNAANDLSSFETEVKSKIPTSTRHLLLIRHGQYDMEPKDDIERCLTALGKEQADITGKRLKELNLPYTKLISSTMTRAKETGDIIHKHLSHLSMERDELLREGAPIPPEPPSSNWRPEASQFFKEGARIEAAFRRHFHRADADQTTDSYEVYVCHANVIRYFVCRALQFPPEGWLRMSLAHGSITHVVIRPSGRVHIRSLGESGHIPADKISFS